MRVSKELRIEDVEFTIDVSPDYDPVRGSLESGDPDYADQEREEEDKILAAIDAGYTWAWCIVDVQAKWSGLIGSAGIGSVSILPEQIPPGIDKEEFFIKEYGCFEELKSDAIEDLKNNMVRLGWTIDQG